MGALYVKVGGSWIPVANAPTDEVYIGTDDPGVGPELWYDTDAQGVVGDKPWNTAWGVIGRVAAVTQNSIPNVGTDLTGLSITWTAVAGRLYRASMFLMVLPPSNATGITMITDGSNNVLSRFDCYTAASGAHAGASQFVLLAPGAGSNTVKGRAQAGATTMNINATNSQGWLLVEDIGPS